MSQYLESEANLKHALAFIAPQSRGLYVQVEFEVFGNIHGVNYTKVSKCLYHFGK